MQLRSEELLLGSFLGMWVLTLKRSIVLSNLWVLKVPPKLIFIRIFFAGSVLGNLCAVNLTLLNFCYVNKGSLSYSSETFRSFEDKLSILENF